MSEEEWVFFIIMVCAGILAAVVIINNAFSVQTFWARVIRSRNPPTPEALIKAHTTHQQFYFHTNQRLFETTYVSFYLFVLSFIGILVMNALILMQDLAKEETDECLLRLFYITVFLLISRWYYRQESSSTTAQHLIAILSGVIIIDFVHLLSGVDYVQVSVLLILLWVWMIGVLRAVLSYKVNYARDVAFSFGIPFAVIYYLVRADANAVLLIIAPLFVLPLREFLTKSTEYAILQKFFPNPLPFNRDQPNSFFNDIMYSLFPRQPFAACSVWEVLFWFSMTPVVLVPVTLYVQGREEKIQQWHHHIVEWSQNEYVLDPETVADRMGLTLVDTYPLLNELTETGELTVYKGQKGLLYGLPPSGEMNAFIKKLNLQKTNLPQKDRDLLEYIVGKQRMIPPKTVLLSIIKRDNTVEVSVEPAGGTISALVPSIIMTDTALEEVSCDINRLIGMTVDTLGLFEHYIIKNPGAFLPLLQKKGTQLLAHAVPESMRDYLDEMNHIVLETNINDTPFELMWDNHFFAVKYAVGRRLKVSGPVCMTREDVERIRALIIADPAGDLKDAVTECDYITDELNKIIDTDYLIQREATCERVADFIQSGYTLIHYAGHVDEKGLQLSNGWLDSFTIQQIVKGSPLVFINGCQSAGRATTALAEAFLQAGAVGYIGSVWDIHDVAAAHLAVDFYTNSLHHHTIGEALRMAKESALQKRSIAWACFVLFGDPTLQLI